MKPRLLLMLFALLVPLAAHSANPLVEMKTNMGTITLELYPDKAPKTVENFLQYVNSGFYTDVIFHRVIPGFMIQGGGFKRDLLEDPTRAPIKNEADNGLKNEAYTIAMARTSDPHSATAQFFINVANNSFLNFTAPTPQGYGYCVLGRVVQGTEVVDKIAAIPTTSVGPLANLPKKAVIIERMKVVPQATPSPATPQPGKKEK